MEKLSKKQKERNYAIKRETRFNDGNSYKCKIVRKERKKENELKQMKEKKRMERKKESNQQTINKTK